MQALLYTAALHRFLRWRLPGYDPERNLAGVLSLFLLGMTGARTPTVAGTPCGGLRVGAVESARGGAERRARSGGGVMTTLEPAVADPYDVARARGAAGLLREFNDAGVLTAADVHVARRLAHLTGEENESVWLAAALAVRGPRLVTSTST